MPDALSVPAGSAPLASHRPTVLALAAVSLFFLFLTLSPARPGLPPNLKADEAAYYLMARSLGEDLDLRVQREDTERLFEEYPFRPTRNLIVMSDDGWQTAYFGKPYLYSLLAAPFAVVLGANGLLLLNALLFLALVWMGAAFLSRIAPPPVAALFSAGFFFVSAIFPYVFWLHPEVFTACGVAAALFLVFERRFEDPSHRAKESVLMALSGAALALSAYHKPMYAAVVLALVGPPLLERRLRPAAAWLAGFLLTLALAAGVAVLLTGHPSAYLGVERMGVTVCQPDAPPVEVEELRAARQGAVAGPADINRETGKGAAAPPVPHSSWAWVLRKPPVGIGEVVENLGYFLWGRHAGLLPYFPFAGLAVVLFLLYGRRSPTPAAARWLLLGSLAIVALYFLIFINWNWQGGGGFVGNRYYVAMVPGFLFLVPRVRAWAVLAGYALGGLSIGALLLTPFGAPVPEPTLQAHARNLPLRLLPLELSLRNVPGYHSVNLGGVRVIGRTDQVLPQGERLWLQAAAPVELLLVSSQPLGASVFQLDSPAAPNRFALSMGGVAHRLEVERPGQGFRLELGQKPYRVRTQRREPQWVYRLRFRSDRGAVREWVRYFPPVDCGQFPYNESIKESFYSGAELLYLGSPEHVAADVYALDWGLVQAPETMAPDTEALIKVELFNRSAAAWSGQGSARVKLAYHWLDEAGQMLERDGLRTELPGVVAPGSAIQVEARIRAPERPGIYLLELDPVFEYVAWFSEKGAATYRTRVVVE